MKERPTPASGAVRGRLLRLPRYRTLVVSALLGGVWPAVCAFAQGSAWLNEPGSGYASLSVVSQVADEFYRGKVKRPTPRGEDLGQNTVWLTANYSFNDSLALDAQVGWARSEFVVGPMIPTPMEHFSGMVDSTIGLTWRVNDELASDLPSVAVRAGAIIAGNYDTGYINSLGDGGNGYELSVVVGEFVSNRVGLSAEFGYRSRDSGIPSETFTNLTGVWLLGERLSLGLDYKVVNARDGLDIGGEGFDPTRFPEVEEDSELVAGRLYYNASESLSFAVFHAAVVNGRNAPASAVYGATISYSFSAF